MSNETFQKGSLTSKVAYGGFWLYIRIFLTNAINLGVMAILARQLKPSEFGIVALANVILRFLMVLGAEGVSEFVIYDNKEGREERINAAFWMDLTFAIGAILISLPFIHWVAQFYNELLLEPILFLLLLKFLIETTAKVPDALLKKNLDFKKLAIRDTILEIFVSLFSVAMALNGFGVWSLIIPGLIAAPIRVIFVFFLTHWIPKIKFYFKYWGQIFSYSSNVIGGTLTSYALSEGDTLLIGKFLGSENLGIYNLAYQSANIIPRNITVIGNKLAFPALSKMNNDILKLKESTHKILRFLSFITFPLLIGLFIVADEFVMFVYGLQWERAVLPLRIMIIFAIRYSVGAVGSSLWKAIGRTDISFKLGLATIPFYLFSIWFGSNYGIVGVAIAVTVVRTFFGLVGFKIMSKCLNENFLQILKPMVPAFVASCLMAGVVMLLNIFIKSFVTNNKLFLLSTSITSGGIFFIIFIRNFYQSSCKEISNITSPILGVNQKFINKILNIK